MPIELNPQDARRMKMGGAARELPKQISANQQIASSVKRQTDALIVLAKTQLAMSDKVGKCVEMMAAESAEPEEQAKPEEWHVTILERDQYHDIKRVSLKKVI